jgi:hypothetical protein
VHHVLKTSPPPLLGECPSVECLTNFLARGSASCHLHTVVNSSGGPVIQQIVPQHGQHDDRVLDVLQTLGRLRAVGMVEQHRVVVGSGQRPLSHARVRSGSAVTQKCAPLVSKIDLTVDTKHVCGLHHN